MSIEDIRQAFENAEPITGKRESPAKPSQKLGVEPSPRRQTAGGDAFDEKLDADEREMFEERAAIIEFLGGISRERAEFIALGEVRRKAAMYKY